MKIKVHPLNNFVLSTFLFIFFYSAIEQSANAQYAQMGKCITHTERYEDQSRGDGFRGSRLSISKDGNTMAVGLEFYTRTGIGFNNVGAVKIYSRQGVNWIFEQEIVNPNTNTGNEDNFGNSVALSADGKTLVVGAYNYYDGDLASYTGGAYIFTKTANRFSQYGPMLVGSNGITALFGSSVDISDNGNTVIIGGEYDKVSATNDENQASAWVFVRGNETYIQLGEKLRGDDQTINDNFGRFQVAISGDGNTAVMGAFNNNSTVGAVYVFVMFNYTFVQQGPALVGTGYTGTAPRQGSSVAISDDGNTVLFGGFQVNTLTFGGYIDPYDGPGSAWIFTRTGTSWSQDTRITIPSTGDYVNFGIGVALTGDGNTAYITGSNDSLNTGAFWVYKKTQNIWSQVGKFKPFDKDSSHFVGATIGINGDGSLIALGAQKTFYPDFTFLRVSTLTSTSATLNPTESYPNDTITFNGIIRNPDNYQTSTTTYFRYYLSKDNVYDATDTPISSQMNKGNISAGADLTYMHPLEFSNLTEGTYWILEVRELPYPNTYAQNNVLTSVSLKVGNPDLILSSLNAPATLAEGGKYNITCSLTNRGSINTQNLSQINFYLSSDSLLDDKDVALATDTVGFKKAGTVSNYSATITIPTVTTAGTYYILAVADPLAKVAESNENNNIASIKTTIVFNPDIRVTSVLVNPTTLEQGKSISVSASVTNIGKASAGSRFYVRYFISTSPTFTNTLIPHIDSTSIPVLASQQSIPVTVTIPISVSTAPGTYYVFVYADQGKVLSDPNISNNVVSSPYTVVIQPDISLRNLSVLPASVSHGNNFTVNTAMVTSSGIGAGTKISLKYYLSSDTVYDDADIILTDTIHLNVLVPGSPQNALQQTFKISPTTNAGNYYVLVIADRENTIAESNEKNNLLYSKLTIINLPDIEVNSITSTSPSVMQGKALVLNGNIINKGLVATTGNFYVRYFISQNPTFSNTLVPYKDSLLVGSLTPQQSVALNVSIPIATTTAPGIYYVYVFADQGRKQNETVVTNNVSSTTFTVVTPPDISLTNIAVNPTRIIAGSSFTVNVTSRNTGGSNTNLPFSLQYFLSNDSLYDQFDLLLTDTVHIPNINAASTLNARQQTFKLPTELVAGDYFIIIVADKENVVAEINENNNNISLQLLLSSLPDLVIANPSLNPGAVLPGGNISIGSSVSNQGGSSSGMVTAVQYFLSLDNILDANDQKLGDTVRINSLGAGVSQVVRAKTVQIPTNVLPGNYYVLYVVNQDKSINESSFANNMSYLALSVSNYADLLPMNGQATPQQGLSEAEFSISFQVLNSSSTAAGISTAKLYFSKDSVLDNSDAVLNGSLPVKAMGAGEMAVLSASKLTIPSGNLPGAYYIIAVADADKNVTESNELNNTQVIKYTVVSPSDILISAASSTPSTIFAGDSILLGCTVENSGGTDVVSPFLLRYVLSTDAQYDSLDIILSSLSINALPSGGSIKETIAQFQIPSSTSPGKYSIILIVDPLKSLLDQNRANNFKTFLINIVSLPDLRVVNFTTNPSNVLTGNSININADILNSGGTTTISNNTVKIFLSQNLTLEESDYLVGEQTIGPLGPGAKQSIVPINYLVPDTMKSGNFNIIATIDPENLVRESDEKNNLSAVGLSIGRPDLPDLIVSNFYVSSSITLGEQINIESSVDNIGGAGAGSSTLEYYLSKDEIFDIYDIQLGTAIQTGPISSGKSYQATTIQYTLPANLTAGNYFIVANINRSGNLKESNQNNNIVSSLIKILALPDLIISTPVLATSSGYPGESTSLKCSVRNVGSGPTGASVSVQIFLSNDQVYDDQDVVISSLVPIPVIAAGDSFEVVAAKAFIPSSTAPGNYHVLIVADAGMSVKETNETNNVTYVKYELKSMPDLAIENRYASPSTVFQDDITNLSCTIKNIGAGAAPVPSTLILYLSKDRLLDSDDEILGTKFTIPALSAGAESTVFSYNYHIPTFMTSATYYILLVADVDTALHEMSRSNNYASIRLTVGNPDLTDITLSYNFVSPSSLVAGDSASVECVVTNIGALPVTQTYQVRYYLSRDQDYDNSDIALGEGIKMGSLSVGKNDSIDARKFKIPSTVTPGNYNILSFADDENVVAEANEENNIEVFSFRVLPYPDLVITKIIEDTNSIYIADTLNLISTIRNSGGTATTKSTTIQYYLSKDQVLDSMDIAIGKGFFIKALLSTQLLKDSASVMIPVTTTAGKYYILAQVDPNNLIPEVSEVNNSISVPITIRPRPFITFPLNQPVSVNVINNGITVGAFVNSHIPLSSVTFSFRKITDSSTTVTQSLLLKSDQYKGDIPASFIDEIGTEYEFMATDKEGNRSLPGKGSIHVNHTMPGLEIPYSAFGINAGNYRIISVPLNLSNNSIDSVFAEVLGSYDKKKWRFFNYRDGANIEFQNSLTNIEPGKGYWLIIKNKPPTTLTSGKGITVNATIDKPFSLKLVQGWNQVGNPYNMHLSFDDIKNFRNNRKGKSLKFIKWLGNWNIEGDTLHKMEGAFVFATDTMTLYFPTQKNKSIQTRRGMDEIAMTPEQWQVNLKLKEGDMNYSLAGFGMHENANISADDFDLFTPPTFGEVLEINFLHPEYFYPKFTRDVTTSCPEHVWHFEVNSGQVGEKILSWDNTYMQISGKKYMLLDEEKETILNMAKFNTYQYEGRSRNFRILYGSEDFVNNNFSTDKVMIGIAPNPFGESATVSVVVEEDVFDASLEIFNSLGKHELTLLKGEMKRGFHEFRINKQMENGNKLSDGVYLVRFQMKGAAGLKNYSKKIIIK